MEQNTACFAPTDFGADLARGVQDSGAPLELYYQRMKGLLRNKTHVEKQDYYVDGYSLPLIPQHLPI